MGTTIPGSYTGPIHGDNEASVRSTDALDCYPGASADISRLFSPAIWHREEMEISTLHNDHFTDPGI
jgi:hypothetical protein